MEHPSQEFIELETDVMNQPGEQDGATEGEMYEVVPAPKRSEVREVIREYGEEFEVSERAVKRIVALREIREEYDLPRNPSVFHEELLNEVAEDHFPSSGTKELGILYLLYRREGSSRELGRVGDQPAAQVRDLRQKGFRCFHPDAEDGIVPKGGTTTYKPQDATENHRKIIKYEAPAAKVGSRVSPRVRRQFLKGKRDPLNGTTSRLEVDHRMPVSACRKAGVEPKELTEQMIEAGTAEEHFQVLSRQNNQIKRQVCQACLRGEEIRIPSAFEKYKDHYKRYWTNQGEDSCKGCFWYNPHEPEVPLPESTAG